LIVGKHPLGGCFFQTGVRRRKHKPGQTKQFLLLRLTELMFPPAAPPTRAGPVVHQVKPMPLAEVWQSVFSDPPPPHPSLKEAPPQGVLSYDQVGLGCLDGRVAAGLRTQAHHIQLSFSPLFSPPLSPTRHLRHDTWPTASMEACSATREQGGPGCRGVDCCG